MSKLRKRGATHLEWDREIILSRGLSKDGYLLFSCDGVDRSTLSKSEVRVTGAPRVPPRFNGDDAFDGDVLALRVSDGAPSFVSAFESPRASTRDEREPPKNERASLPRSFVEEGGPSDARRQVYDRKLDASEAATNFAAAVPRSPPVAVDAAVDLNEDGEAVAGSMLGVAPRSYAAPLAADLLRRVALAKDVDDDPTYPTYDETGPRGACYVSALPDVGELLLPDGTVAASAPFRVPRDADGGECVALGATHKRVLLQCHFKLGFERSRVSGNVCPLRDPEGRWRHPRECGDTSRDPLHLSSRRTL